ncbi:hypothetical protein E8E11_002768 [Didymella keratinophila]|nr:hypothetical protein E8E11_002768 [Didymella keratinophila]
MPTITPGPSVGIQGTKASLPPPPSPKKTQVTLSGMLNLLDGFGSKEGHIVIITMNAPKSLDPALYRDGRSDVQVHLGYSTKATAAVTFERIFKGSKRNKHRKAHILRMAAQFGQMVPKNFLTPAEILSSCMKPRTNAVKALREFPAEIKRKRDKSVSFEYDINAGAPEPEFDDDGECIEWPDLTEHEAADFEESNDQDKDNRGNAGPPEVPAEAAPEMLHLAGSELDDESDGLAYGDYCADTSSEDVYDRIGDGIGHIVSFFTTRTSMANNHLSGHVSLSEMVMPQMRMRAITPEALLQFYQYGFPSSAVEPSFVRTTPFIGGFDAHQAGRRRETRVDTLIFRGGRDCVRSVMKNKTRSTAKTCQ